MSQALRNSHGYKFRSAWFLLHLLVFYFLSFLNLVLIQIECDGISNHESEIESG